jgi:hypothetical protein
MPTHYFGTFDIHARDNATTSLFAPQVQQLLHQAGELREGTQLPMAALSLEAEETGLAQMDPELASVSLARPREYVLACLQAIVRDAFDRHDLAEDIGLDVGSGASGYMVAKLLPYHAQGTWLQMEICPRSVALNQQQNPGKMIIQGSYHRLVDQGVRNTFSTITGLSSLDATAHLEHAVEQVCAALKPGGHLLHVQDTRPGQLLSQQQLAHEGSPGPWNVVLLRTPNALQNRVIDYVHLGQLVHVQELFRRRLARAIVSCSDLELLESRWVTAVGPASQPAIEKWYEYGTFTGLPTPEGPGYDSASAVVTVARRRR